VVIEELRENLVAESGVDRSPGLHVSEIIDDILTTLYGNLHPGEEVDQAKQGQFEKGFIWERLLSSAFGERSAVRPSEVEKDGIVGSPDGINRVRLIDGGGIVYGNGERVLEEYKCTTYSSTKDPGQNERWIMQVKAYCYMLGLQTCLFRILYLLGDYRENRYPIYKVWLLDFTELELRENWDMIINHARFKGWLPGVDELEGSDDETTT